MMKRRYLRPLFALIGLALIAPSVQAQEATKKEASKKAQAKPAAPPSTTEPVARAENGFWMTRHKLFLDRIRDGKAGVLFIGDSITQGWEAAGKDIWRRHYAPRNAVNLGIGGDGTQHVLWRLDHGEIDGIKPKVAVIMIGTNNMGRNSPQEIAEGNKQILERLRKKLPETKILLLGIFPRSAGSEDPVRRKVQATNALIAKLADGKNIHYLDISAAFLETDGSLSKAIMPDFLHLSPEGYRRWADAIEPKLWDLCDAKAPAGKVAK